MLFPQIVEVVPWVGNPRDVDAGVDDEFINWNPGDLLNWATEEFGGASIDHSLSKETFSLIIYKQ